MSLTVVRKGFCTVVVRGRAAKTAGAFRPCGLLRWRSPPCRPRPSMLPRSSTQLLPRPPNRALPPAAPRCMLRCCLPSALRAPCDSPAAAGPCSALCRRQSPASRVRVMRVNGRHPAARPAPGQRAARRTRTQTAQPAPTHTSCTTAAPTPPLQDRQPSRRHCAPARPRACNPTAPRPRQSPQHPQRPQRAPRCRR